MKVRIAFAALVCLCAGLTGCTADASFERDARASVLAELPRQDVSQAQPSRATPDLAPPTNRWYSGMVFGEQPQTVYPFPLAVTPSDAAFSLSLPVPHVGVNSIASATGPVLSVDVGAITYEVVRADPVAVTVSYLAGDDTLGEMTLAEGWPVVGYLAKSDSVLTPSVSLTPESDGVWTARVGDQNFGVAAPDATWSDGKLQVPAGSSAQWFAVPSDSNVHAWASALDAPITGAEASYDIGAREVTTTLNYRGSDRTIIVPFPAHALSGACGLGTFDTPYGQASACAGVTSEWSTPALAPTAQYDFAELDSATSEQLAAQVAIDLDATLDPPSDTYYGGKALARLSALLEIARSIGQTDLADRVADRLEVELAPWVDVSGCETRVTKCFVYDESLRTIVGLESSFGSEQANDHHFHYGNFLTAAASLVAYRPEKKEQIAPVIDLLAADIADGADDEMLATLRVFDPYRGHSWASGLSPFADGNNQESSSEAVASWNGLALWADAVGDDDLAATARWLLSAESNAATTLWLEPDSLPSGYDHGIVSLTWGGKRDYATWFSAEPSAILGIQLLPLGPVALQYIAGDSSRVDANVAEAGGMEAANGALGDYVAMYSALGSEGALERARSTLESLPDNALDGGNSRSAVLAWLAAVELRGANASR